VPSTTSARTGSRDTPESLVVVLGPTTGHPDRHREQEQRAEREQQDEQVLVRVQLAQVLEDHLVIVARLGRQPMCG
jgi:hypothetical protein